MSLCNLLSSIKSKLSRKQISDRPQVSARKKIRRSQKKMKKFDSIEEYNNLRKSNSLDGPTKLCISELDSRKVQDSGDYDRIYKQYYKPIPVRSKSKLNNEELQNKQNDIEQIKHHLIKFEDLMSNLIEQHCQQVEHMKLIVKRIDKEKMNKKDQKLKLKNRKSQPLNYWSNETFWMYFLLITIACFSIILRTHTSYSLYDSMQRIPSSVIQKFTSEQKSTFGLTDDQTFYIQSYFDNLF